MNFSMLDISERFDKGKILVRLESQKKFSTHFFEIRLNLNKMMYCLKPRFLSKFNYVS